MRVFFTAILFLLTSCGEPPTPKERMRKSVGNSVVRIFGKTKSGRQSGGTGFSVYAPSGKRYILTNRHICQLADNNNNLIVEFPNKTRRYKRRIIEISESHDLCLVESLPTFSNALFIANFLEKGDSIFVVGHPKLFALTVAEGEYIEPARIVIATNNLTYKPIAVRRGVKIDLGGFTLQLTPMRSSRFNVYSRGGNSGSPIVNSHGQVISVLFAGNPYDVMETYGVPLKEVKSFIEGY